MRDLGFFEQIVQAPRAWRDHTVPTPSFLYEGSVASAAFLTPIERVREQLPSGRLQPLRVTPWHAITFIGAYDVRDSDLGAYQQLLVGFPVGYGESSSLDRLARAFSGEGPFFVKRMLTSTELARDVAGDLGGFPSALAEIDMQRSSFGLVCEVFAAGQHILRFEVKGLHAEPSRRRLHVEPVTVQGGRLLRSSMVWRLHTFARSTRTHAVHLQLGEHPLAEDLIDLELGRPVRVEFAPYVQSVLTGPVESLPAQPAEAPALVDLEARMGSPV